MAFNVDIVEAAKANRYFRTVLSTGTHAQVVVMSIPAGGEIGEEVHEHVDQVLAFVQGEGVAILDGEESAVGPNRLVHVPAGTRHNFVNRGSDDLRLYTVYAPPQHAPGTVHRTKAEADADEADHYAQTTPAGSQTAADEKTQVELEGELRGDFGEGQRELPLTPEDVVPGNFASGQDEPNPAG